MKTPCHQIKIFRIYKKRRTLPKLSIEVENDNVSKNSWAK